MLARDTPCRTIASHGGLVWRRDDHLGRGGWTRCPEHRWALRPLDGHMGADVDRSQRAACSVVAHGGVDRHGNDCLEVGGSRWAHTHRPNDTWTPMSYRRQTCRRGEPSTPPCGPAAEMIVWGGSNGSGYENSGGRYDPATSTWTSTSTGGQLCRRRRDRHTAVWTGSGNDRLGRLQWHRRRGYLDPGARYQPATRTWTLLPTANALTARPLLPPHRRVDRRGNDRFRWLRNGRCRSWPVGHATIPPPTL